MFSNGTEWEIFMESYCFKCSRYKTDREGIPYKNSCKYENQMFRSSMGDGKFPKVIVRDKEKGYTKCTEFQEVSLRKQARRKYTIKRKEIDGQIHF